MENNINLLWCLVNMAFVFLDNGVKLEFIDEAEVFDPIQVEEVASRLTQEGIFSLLHHPGFACKYLELYHVRGPVKLVGPGHPTHPGENETLRLVANLVDPRRVQIGINCQKVYDVNVGHLGEDYFHKIPNQEGVYLTCNPGLVGDHMLTSSHVCLGWQSKKVINPYNNERDLRAIITGDAVCKQLETWGIKDREEFRGFL